MSDGQQKRRRERLEELRDDWGDDCPEMTEEEREGTVPCPRYCLRSRTDGFDFERFLSLADTLAEVRGEMRSCISGKDSWPTLLTDLDTGDEVLFELEVKVTFPNGEPQDADGYGGAESPMRPRPAEALTEELEAVLCDYEDGHLSDADAWSLFQHLINTGLAWTLPGHYGRRATHLIDEGLCALGEVPCFDSGNRRVPARHEVAEGTPGSIGHLRRGLAAPLAEVRS